MADLPQTKYNVWRSEPEYPGDPGDPELINREPLNRYDAAILAMEVVNIAVRYGYRNDSLSPSHPAGSLQFWTLRSEQHPGRVITIDVKQVPS